MRKKRPLLLFELIIALGLTAILLTVLFRFLVQSARFDQKIEKARAALYARQHLQSRLSTFLTSVIPRSALTESLGTSFYTSSEEELIAIFDNGIDPDPAFSGEVVGSLFIDPEQNLSLGLWPLSKERSDAYRKEILMPRVEHLRFQFLAKKNPHHPDPKAVAITPTLEWRTNWPKNRWDIPSLIRLTVEQEGREIAFAFALPFVDPLPTYREGS